MKVRLNKRTIDDATYEEPGGCYLWDTAMPGFGVRLYPTGRKSFVVSCWTKGRRRFYTLGPYGKLTHIRRRVRPLRSSAWSAAAKIPPPNESPPASSRG